MHKICVVVFLNYSTMELDKAIQQTGILNLIATFNTNEILNVNPVVKGSRLTDGKQNILFFQCFDSY